MKSPNLLFVFADQHRYFDLGCNGNKELKTPHFDAFAAQALNATHCISNTPVCVPMRGSMLTGRMPIHHDAVTNDLPINTERESIAMLMNAAGYTTGYYGKWHLAGVPRDQFVNKERRLGFQEWKVSNCNHRYMDGNYWDDEDDKRHPIQGYDAITQTDQAIDFLERHCSDGPWGLVLSWGPPHDPYDQVPERYKALYDPATLTLRGNVCFPVRRTNTSFYDEAAQRERIRGYYAHISALDEQFGRLLATLEATGQSENTIVVYTSDHGDMLGSQGESNKQLPYEEAVRVPLMLRWPGRIQQGVQEGLVGLVDLPVGLMGLMGLSFGGETEGRSCMELLSDPGAPGFKECDILDYVPCHQASSRAREGYNWRGVRTERWTYAVALNAEGVGWLYDNQEDPLQRVNRFLDPTLSALRAELNAYLKAREAAVGELVPWETLLTEHGLWPNWEKSEEYFGGRWKRGTDSPKGA